MRASLSETDVAADPVQQFQRWFDEALRAGLPTVNAMTLATVDAAGAPSARIVLLKGIDQNGFVFYTNYQSRKGRELAANPRASLVQGVSLWMPIHSLYGLRQKGLMAPQAKKQEKQMILMAMAAIIWLNSPSVAIH